MISYRPLWNTMHDKGVTTYTLRFKYKISHSTVERLQKDEPVSTYTVDRLCKLLGCGLNDIMEYIPDEE